MPPRILDLRKLLGIAPAASPELVRGQTLAGQPDFPGSAGDRERLKFRESLFARLVQVAVSNDDGSPISEATDERLAQVLANLETIRDLLLGSAPDAQDAARFINALQQSPDGSLYITGRVYQTPRQVVPGVGTGVAYAAGDAFGTKMTFPVPLEGTISNVIFRDYDDEGLTKELVLFRQDFTDIADNAAFNVADIDLQNCIGVVSITSFYNFGVNQMGQGTPALAYVLSRGELWGQLVTRGADNIAAGAIPELTLVIVQ